MLAPYKQEVARSSRAPPIFADPPQKPTVCQGSSGNVATGRLVFAHESSA